MAVKRCPFCDQLMDYPKDFPGLEIEQYALNVLFKLWHAHGEVLTYAQISGGNTRLHKRRAQVYIMKARDALRDTGVPWIIDIERGIGARLVKIEVR